MVELSLNFTPPKDPNFFITGAAAMRISQLIEFEGRVNQTLQIKVKPGGCSGFVYDFAWVKTDSIGLKFEKDGSSVIIQEADLRLVDGSTLDYIENLAGSKFEIINPNAQNTCGCGKSFS